MKRTESQTGTRSISSIEDLGFWAEKMCDEIFGYSVVLLQGTMGSGKTTLVNFIVRAAGGSNASSPTFSLVNEYDTPKGKIYHFDLYRLEKEEELTEIGFEEYLNSGHLCLIEWPELGASFYPEDTATVHIEAGPDGRRTISWYKGIKI